MNKTWLFRGYLFLGALYVLLKIGYVAAGYLHTGAILHGVVPSVLTLLAGIFALRASGKGSESKAWNRVLLILPVLIFVITPVFMYLKMGAEEWLTEGRASVLVIYLVMAVLQTLIAIKLMTKSGTKTTLKPPLPGILAFFMVLLTMPLGHAAMIMMEKFFGEQHVIVAALILGFLGFFLLIWGNLSHKETRATFLGLFAGLFIWTGWIEFAYVYYANRFGVEPLVVNGEVVTKPEYLILPSSIGFWAILMIYYFFGTRTGCKLFTWMQKVLKLSKKLKFKPAVRNVAMTTFMELTALLWTFYLVLLILYDERFFGDHHAMTYVVAFGCLLWSLFLFIRLLKIAKLAYAIRYAIPTVIIFWNFVEILARWNVFKEIWVEPLQYWLEMLITLMVFIILMLVLAFEKKKTKVTSF